MPQSWIARYKVTDSGMVREYAGLSIGSRDGIQVMIQPGIGSLRQDTWDAMVSPGNFFHSYAWLLSLEEILGPQRVITASRGGILLGGLPVWDADHGRSGLFRLPDLFPGLPGPWTERFLWLGAYRSACNGLDVCPGPERRLILSELFSAAADMARDEGMAGVIMPYMPRAYAEELSAVHTGARVLMHSAEASMDVPTDGYAEVLQRLDGRHRRKFRAELRRFRQAGTTIEWQPVSESLHEPIAALITMNRAKYGSDEDAGWMRTVLRAQQKSGVLKSAIAGICRRGSRPIGVLLGYTRGRHFYARYAGFDDTAPDPAFEYFVLIYYAAVDYAAACGFRVYHLSTSALEAKVRRGARLSPLAAVMVRARGEPIAERLADAHNARFLGTYLRDFGSRPRALNDEWDELPRHSSLALPTSPEVPGAASCLPVQADAQGPCRHDSVLAVGATAAGLVLQRARYSAPDPLVCGHHRLGCPHHRALGELRRRSCLGCLPPPGS